MSRRMFIAVAFSTSLVAVPASADWKFWRKSQPAKSRPGASVAAGLPLTAPKYLSELFVEAGRTFGVDPKLIAAVTFRESAFNPQAESRRGAQGLMQLMPRTARYLGVRDPFDPRENVLGGTKYLKEMLDTFNGDVDLALAGYNAGPTAVKKKGVAATQEAVEYVAAVKEYYRRASRS